MAEFKISGLSWEFHVKDSFTLKIDDKFGTVLSVANSALDRYTFADTSQFISSDSAFSIAKGFLNLIGKNPNNWILSSVNKNLDKPKELGKVKSYIFRKKTIIDSTAYQMISIENFLKIKNDRFYLYFITIQRYEYDTLENRYKSRLIKTTDTSAFDYIKAYILTKNFLLPAIIVLFCVLLLTGLFIYPLFFFKNVKIDWLNLSIVSLIISLLSSVLIYLLDFDIGKVINFLIALANFPGHAIQAFLILLSGSIAAYKNHMPAFPKIWSPQFWREKNIISSIYTGYLGALACIGISVFISSIFHKIGVDINDEFTTIIISCIKNPFLGIPIFSLNAAIFEEIIFRFFLFNTLKKLLKSNWITIILSILIWAVFHDLGAISFKTLILIGYGFIFTYAMLHAGIIAAIIAHFVIDIIALLIFFIPIYGINISLGILPMILLPIAIWYLAKLLPAKKEIVA